MDATRIKGSHGAPAADRAQRSVLVASQPILPEVELADTDVFGIVLGHFGLQSQQSLSLRRGWPRSGRVRAIAENLMLRRCPRPHPGPLPEGRG